MSAIDSFVMKGRTLTFFERPDTIDSEDCYDYEESGALVIQDGMIVWRGRFSDLSPDYSDWPVIDHGEHLLLPGFIDTHTHFPQMGVIASYGTQLLDWLETYTFKEESRFSDPAHCQQVAASFLDELIGHGVTTASVFATSHPESASALFDAALTRNMRMVAGKVLMDRGAPDELCDTPQRAYDESAALIKAWHGHGRLAYAITPRFAITSTPEQMEMAQALVQRHPDCYMQTHLSENAFEIAETLRLYPEARDYTDVYERYGLLGEKSLFGHCIHLSSREQQALIESQSVAVFCPSSNLFLGSGLFDYSALKQGGMRIGLASDIGGGTSYSMLATAAEAYKICQLRGYSMNPFESFYTLTLGNARAMTLDDKIGTLDAGTEADIVVLDSKATSALRARMVGTPTLAEELFALQILGDDRSIVETYVAGTARKRLTRQDSAAL